MKGYKLIERKGRNIQVVFDNRPFECISTGTKNRAAAIAFAESRKEQTTVEKKAVTLGEFAKGFFFPEDPHGYRNRNEMRHDYHDDAYYQDRQSKLDHYILPAHGQYLISAITDTMIEDLFLNLKSIKRKSNLDDSSKNKVLATYRIVLDAAKREGFIRTNPANTVKEITERKERRVPFTESEMDILFPQDDEKLLSIWYNLKWACYFCVLKDTGWRPGEVAALSVKNFLPNLEGGTIHGVFTDEEVSWRTHKIVKRIKTSSTPNGAKSKQGFVTEQTARLLIRLSEIIKGEYFFEMRTEDLPKSHRRKDTGTQYIYAELANDRLTASAKSIGIKLNGRTQYCFRHTWNTFYFGKLPDAARLLLMGHVKDRAEYLHLSPLQALERVVSIPGVKEALGFSDTVNETCKEAQ